jgi:GTPase KRas protein
MYNITNRDSFEEVHVFRQQILRVKDKEYFPMLLVGSKCDLEYERAVRKEEGRDLAKAFGCPFLEVSAKNRINVDEVFAGMVREIRRYYRERPIDRILTSQSASGSEKKEDATCIIM